MSSATGYDNFKPPPDQASPTFAHNSRDFAKPATDRDRRRWWKLSDTTLMLMQGVRASELSALDMAVKRAQHEGTVMDVRGLVSLRDRLLASMPSIHARKTETDAAAMLEAQGLACRPGPKARITPNILGAIAEGIKAPFSMDIVYQAARDTEPRMRKVEPYGLMLGTRRYLIGRDIENGPPRHPDQAGPRRASR